MADNQDDTPSSPNVDPDELEALRDWEAFWEEFEEAAWEQKLKLAGEQLEDNPNFDSEWAFELTVQLADGADEPREFQKFGDLLEEMRDHHPQATATPETLAHFQRHLVRARLLGGGPVPDEEIARLPQAFRLSPEVVESAVDMAMYHGRGGPLIDALLAEWPEVRDDTDLIGGKSEYAWNTITLAIGEAVASGGTDQTGADTDAIFRRLEPIVDPERQEELKHLIGHVTGEEAVEPGDLSDGELRERIDAATRLCAEAWGRMLRSEDWDWSKATLAFQILEEFYREVFRSREEGGRYTQVKGTRLRRLIDASTPAAFPPGAVAQFIKTFAGRIFDGGYRQAVLVEALDPWLAFLQERDFIGEDLNRQMRPDLTQSIGEAIEPLVNKTDDRLLATNIRKAVTGLA